MAYWRNLLSSRPTSFLTTGPWSARHSTGGLLGDTAGVVICGISVDGVDMAPSGGDVSVDVSARGTLLI